MPSGASDVNLANPWLAVLGTPGPAAGTTFTGLTATYVQLHTGEPGSAGTANVSSVTTRPQLTWGTPAGGVLSITATLPSWTSWAGSDPETVTNISVWDASTSGNFLFSVLLAASQTAHLGDTLALASLMLTLGPIAS